MKIIGGHDYYDGAGYGVDETIVFLRKSAEFTDTPFKLPAPYTRSRRSGTAKLHYFLILCGGEVFPGVRETHPSTYGRDRRGIQIFIQPHDRFHYDLAAAQAALERVSQKSLNMLHGINRENPREALERHFQNNVPKQWTDWMIKNRAITGKVYRPFDHYPRKSVAEVNIATLKDMEFYRAMDPATTHMRIANFIGGVLPHGTEVVEIGNTSKIRKAGFDTETSFRMAKGTKKPRRAKH